MFSPEEIDKVRFTRALYGYSPLEVDGFLSHIRTVVTELCRENETLRAALGDSRFEGAKQRLGKGELEHELAVTARKLAEAAAVSETLKIEVAELRRELAEAGSAAHAGDAGKEPEETVEEAVEEAVEEVVEEDAEEAAAEEITAEDAAEEEPADEAEGEPAADVYTAPDDEYGEDEVPSESADGAEEGQNTELDDIYSDLQKMLVDWDEETDGADILEAAPTEEEINGLSAYGGTADDLGDIMSELDNILPPDIPVPEGGDVDDESGISEISRLFRSGTEDTGKEDDLGNLYEAGSFEGTQGDNAEAAPYEAAPEVTAPVYKKKTYHIKKKSIKKAPAKSDVQETAEQEKEDEDILAALKSEYNTYNYIFGDGKK